MTTSVRLPWARRQGPGYRGAKAVPTSALYIEFPGRRGRRTTPLRAGKRLAATGLPKSGPANPGGADRRRPSRRLRRAADLMGCVVLLLLTLPIQLAVAVLLLLERSGPVLCREERIGLDGRPFPLLSFRSTRADGWAGDPCLAFLGWPTGTRVTRIGRWLRLTRLDELPRLLNVLRGDMSLVGPYAEPPHVVATLSAQLPLYPMRHAVKPGIIGWAQVADPDGASAADPRARLGHDLYYVLHQGWRLDLRILLATLAIILRAVPRGPGAR